MLAEDEEQLQTLLDTVSEDSLKMVLQINTTKTKTIVFTRDPKKEVAHVNINMVTLQGVHSYTGFWLYACAKHTH